MDLRCRLPWLCLERLFSILYMLYMDKGSSLSLDLMLFGVYIMIMIILMFIYVYVYACMSLSNRMMIVLF